MSETLTEQPSDLAPGQQEVVQADQTEAGSGTESSGSEEQTESSAEPEKPEPKPDTTPAWQRRKIDKLTFERREAERQAQQAREEAENLRKALAAARGEESAPEQMTADQIRQQERQKFEQQRSNEQFNARCNVIASSIAQTHGEASVAQSTRMLCEQGGLDMANAQHRSLIEDISDLPNAGDVYYALAHDPDAASDILNAPERRQYAMLTAFAGKVGKTGQAAPAAKAPAISKAPPPVNAPSGAAKSGKRSIYDPNVSPAEFDRLWKSGVRS